MLSALVELLYLIGPGTYRADERKLCNSSRGTSLHLRARLHRELAGKHAVYTELRDHKFTPRTGYKFGHHFRVYSGTNVHSDLLVHAVEKEATLPMSLISRSVRMAHSVKKKMLFGA